MAWARPDAETLTLRRADLQGFLHRLLFTDRYTPPMAWNETERLKKRFQFICDVQWDDMDPTGRPGVRSCSRCETPVFAAPTEAEFDHHASLGRCVFAPTTRGTALVAKPEGPPGPPNPPPLAGAPMPPRSDTVPPPPERPEPIKPQPVQKDYGVGGIPALPPEELARRAEEHRARMQQEERRAAAPPPQRSRLPLMLLGVLAISAVVTAVIIAVLERLL